MKTEPEYQLDEFVFYDRSNWYDRFGYALMNTMYRFSKTTPLTSPIRYKKGFRHWLKILTLADLGKATGIDEEKISLLNFHQRRQIYYRVVAAILSVLITYIPLIAAMFLVLVPILVLAKFVNLNTDSSVFIGYLFISTLVSMWILLSYGIRVAAFIADRYFADTLCIMASLDLLTELSRENSLVIPDMQRSLLFRLRVLARNILLLPYCYESPYAANNAWASAYFKAMASRVREYERWVIAPKKDTLSDLRKEINELTHIFISRNYENVSYELPSTPEVILPSRLNKFTELIIRVIAVAVPVFILGMLYLYPDQISKTGLDKNIVGLVALAWMLLAIDASLGLGVVERISGLAKAIKDLK